MKIVAAATIIAVVFGLLVVLVLLVKEAAR